MRSARMSCAARNKSCAPRNTARTAHYCAPHRHWTLQGPLPTLTGMD
jgi:hypothetical protein